MKSLKIAKHPMHPMVNVFPVAFWTGTVLGDIVYTIMQSEFWYAFSFACLLLGLVTGLMAAFAGAVDWLAIPRHSRAKRLGTYHGVLNLSVWTLFLVNLLFRIDVAGGFMIPPEAPLDTGAMWGGLILSLFAFGLLLIAGWLGGELVYVEGVAVEQVPRPELLDQLVRQRRPEVISSPQPPHEERPSRPEDLH